MTIALTHANSPLSRAAKGTQTFRKTPVEGLTARDREVLESLLMQDEYDFMDDERFYQKDAYRKLFDEAIDIPVPNTDWYHPLMNSANVEAARNQQSLVLTAKQEQALFLQFNYCRYRAAQLREQIDSFKVTEDEGRELLDWHGRAMQLRDQIAHTNLPLVLAMAKRFRGSDLDYADLISEGNAALLRAIDKFNASKGYKLSTYACRAILKSFSRLGVKLNRYRQLFPTTYEPKMERSDFAERRHEEAREDAIDELRRIIRENRADLTDVERTVIEHRFQIDKDSGKGKDSSRKLTLEQVGRLIGVTKERVRQIQAKAYKKLRKRLEADFLV